VTGLLADAAVRITSVRCDHERIVTFAANAGFILAVLLVRVGAETGYFADAVVRITRVRCDHERSVIAAVLVRVGAWDRNTLQTQPFNNGDKPHGQLN